MGSETLKVIHLMQNFLEIDHSETGREKIDFLYI